VIGSHVDIEAARLEDVREFFRLYYAPNNASLAIVGDIDRKKPRPWSGNISPIPAGNRFRGSRSGPRPSRASAARP